MRFQRLLAIFWVLSVAPGWLQGATKPQVCGTARGQAREEVFLHRKQALARKVAVERFATRERAAGPVGRDYGNIAVLYGTNGVISRRNPFNLHSQTITFVPGKEFTEYQFQTGEGSYDEGAAEAGEVLDRLNDDDTRRVELAFAFPFFGKTYRDVWVNSDGNVSFGVGYGESNDRTTGTLTGGPPRIAPLYADLDPSRNLRAVRVKSEAERLVVSWVDVPEFGLSQRQTFQLRLYASGRIEFTYRTVSISGATVGVAPGGAQGSAELVAFAQGSTASYRGAVVERFTSIEELDTVLLAQRFYETHDDAYDFLAVYNTTGNRVGGGALANSLSLRTMYRGGFGDTQVEFGSEYGSKRRLQAFLNMGPLSNYPADPNGPVAARGPTGDTPLSILAHEVGHLFLALASVRDPANPAARPMLGTANAHWSFNFDSDASFLEGNRIEDKGDGENPRFETVATVERYSKLDQYLMGLRPAAEVPPMFYLTRTGRLNGDFPQRGVKMNGQRVDFGVEDLIAAEGERVPDATVAQRRFRIAVVLVVADENVPVQAAVEQLEQLRQEFPRYYEKATDGLSTIETELKRDLQFSLAPAAGVVAGAGVEAVVALNRPAASDVQIVLKREVGIAGMPEAVTIPAGEREARFLVEGWAAGVEKIQLAPADSAYISEEARVQVLESAEDLRLTIVAGDGQVAVAGKRMPGVIEVRVSDRNLLPYAGWEVVVERDEGQVEWIGSNRTGSDGIARLIWTPAGAGTQSLRLRLGGTERRVLVQAR